MSDRKVVLGVHSQVDPATQGSSNRLIDGHAWITVTRGGRTEYYGLWPDDHPRAGNNGDATDIRVGLEAGSGFRPLASRYYELSPEQVARLDTALKADVKWGLNNTCASWASDTVARVTGERLDASELLFTDTPRALIDAIRAAEKRQRTDPEAPRAPDSQQQGSQSFTPPRMDGRSAQLLDDAERGVRAMESSLGRDFDGASERMVGAAAVLARENGLARIDHVLLSGQTQYAAAGEYVHVVQGDLRTDTLLRAHMRTDVAVNTPVEQSLARLAELERAQGLSQAPTRDIGLDVQQQAAQREQQDAPRRVLS